MALPPGEGTTGENKFPTGAPGPARLRCSPVCAGSGRGAAHARLGPEPAGVGAQGRCWRGEPGRGDGGRGLPAAGAAGALSAGFGSCRFPSLRSSITAARAAASPRSRAAGGRARRLGARSRGLRDADAGEAGGSEAGGARRGAAPRGVRSPPCRPQRPGARARPGRARRALRWPARSLPPPLPASGDAAAVYLSHLRLSVAASGRSPREDGITRGLET